MLRGLLKYISSALITTGIGIMIAGGFHTINNMQNEPRAIVSYYISLQSDLTDPNKIKDYARLSKDPKIVREAKEYNLKSYQNSYGKFLFYEGFLFTLSGTFLGLGLGLRMNRPIDYGLDLESPLNIPKKNIDYNFRRNRIRSYNNEPVNPDNFLPPLEVIGFEIDEGDLERRLSEK